MTLTERQKERLHRETLPLQLKPFVRKWADVEPLPEHIYQLLIEFADASKRELETVYIYNDELYVINPEYQNYTYNLKTRKWYKWGKTTRKHYHHFRLYK